MQCTAYGVSEILHSSFDTLMILVQSQALSSFPSNIQVIFFSEELYYKDLPIAYEFDTRSPRSGQLVCSLTMKSSFFAVDLIDVDLADIGLVELPRLSSLAMQKMRHSGNHSRSISDHFGP